MELLALTHNIHYDYPGPIFLGPHIFRLHPLPTSGVQLHNHALQIVPSPSMVHWQTDLFGNRVARATFDARAGFLDITMRMTFCWGEINPLDFLLEDRAIQWPPLYAPDLAPSIAPYMHPPEGGPLFEGFVKRLHDGPASTVAFVSYVAQTIASTVRYTYRLAPGIQNVETTLGERTGSCRDNAWLLIQAVRRLGFAARFVSGYLIELSVKAEEAGVASDRAALHAWADILLPGAGWVAVDPTSGLFAGADHIPLAATPDPALAAPLLGSCEREATHWHYTHTLERRGGCGGSS